MPTDWTAPPDDDEIEITLLGRGFGESVVVHIADGEWVIVDSLRNKYRRSAPLDYLQGLGVSSEKLTTIIATHWHDDHVGGISELYDWADKAKLVMPFAKNGKELSAYINSNSSQSAGNVTGGIAELVKLGQIRVSQGRKAPVHCQADLTILRKTSAALNCEIIIYALSPFPADIDAFLVRLGQANDKSDLAERLMPFEPNDISAATWLKVGDEAILLGADLEVSKDQERGWDAVIASNVRPPGRASLYKIAHHGSENGDHEKIWTELLNPDPFSMLSPFNKGSGLPTAAQKDKIVARSQLSFATNITPFRKYRDAKDAARAALEASKLGMRAGHSEIGVVSARRKIMSEPDWRYTHSGGASALKNFVPRG